MLNRPLRPRRRHQITLSLSQLILSPNRRHRLLILHLRHNGTVNNILRNGHRNQLNVRPKLTNSTLILSRRIPHRLTIRHLRLRRRILINRLLLGDQINPANLTRRRTRRPRRGAGFRTRTPRRGDRHQNDLADSGQGTAIACH